MVSKYRKKPVVIDAMRLDGSWEVADTVAMWIDPNRHVSDVLSFGRGRYGVRIRTLDGTMLTDPDDWVIRGVAGEFYVCKPDIFDATYEPVDAVAEREDGT